ncbi:MAG: hypothetical protein LBS43_01170 [Prevotellaceae bacterium]|nr:hypothetical protein [Prevotellaceae bacterium]
MYLPCKHQSNSSSRSNRTVKFETVEQFDSRQSNSTIRGSRTVRFEAARPVRDEMSVACLAKQMSRRDKMLVETQQKNKIKN